MLSKIDTMIIPEEKKTPLPPGLYEKLVAYIHTNIGLGKLGLIETSSSIGVSLLIGFIGGFLGLLVLFLFGFGLAELISFHNKDSFSGFFWVGGVFLLLLIILILFRNPIGKSFQNKIIQMLSTKLYRDESN